MEENEIKDLGRLFHRVHEAMSRIRSIELSKIGLTSPRVGVLAYIKESDNPKTISAIASRIARELNTVTELLARMEKDGLIRKVRQKKTRQLYTIEITEKGEEYYEKAMKIDIHRKILANLSQEERSHCQAYLSKLQVLAFKELNKLIDIPKS